MTTQPEPTDDSYPSQWIPSWARDRQPDPERELHIAAGLLSDADVRIQRGC